MSVVLLNNEQLEQLGARAKVQWLEHELKKHPQIEIPVTHSFAPGLYIRTIFIPADAITTGKIHKFPCINILHKGKRLTLIEDRIVLVQAPHWHWTPAGHQRASYTIEDAIWQTIHFTTETDIAKLERDLVAETEEEYRAFINLLEMEAPPCLS